MLNALSEKLTYETARDGSLWRYQTSFGKPIAGLIKVSESNEQWQSLTVLLDPEIFNHGVTADGFAQTLQAGIQGDTPFVEPYRDAVEGVPVIVIDSATGKHQKLTTGG